MKITVYTEDIQNLVLFEASPRIACHFEIPIPDAGVVVWVPKTTRVFQSVLAIVVS